MKSQPSITHQPFENDEPTSVLKQTADQAAAALLTTFRRNATVRFNSGGGSGGAFLLLDSDPVKTVGISLNELVNGQIHIHAYIGIDFLQNKARANKGIGTSSYLYEQVASLNEALDLLKNLSNLETY